MSVSSSRSANAPRRAAPVSRLLAFLALVLTVVGQQSGRAQGDPAGRAAVLAQLHGHGRLRGRRRRPRAVAARRTDSRPAPFTWARRRHGSCRRTPKSSRRSSTGKRSPNTVDDLGGVLFRGEPVTFVRTAGAAADRRLRARAGASSGNTLYAMRADVLSLLPAAAGRERQSHGPAARQRRGSARRGLPLHTVTLPERGVGNQTPQSAGASLFVVYRNIDPDGGTAPRRRLRRHPRAGQGRNDGAEDSRVPAVGARREQGSRRS